MLSSNNLFGESIGSRSKKGGLIVSYKIQLQFCAGYRICFGRVGTTVIILLVGGDKSTQTRDIQEAQELWRKYKDEIERYQREFEPGA